MNYSEHVVSIHPYFKVHPGKMDEFKASLPAFIEKSVAEEKNLYYDFTIHGDEVFCREAYLGADGLLEHLANVGALLDTLMKLADLTRMEVHGPAAELDKLKEPLRNSPRSGSPACWARNDKIASLGGRRRHRFAHTEPSFGDLASLSPAARGVAGNVSRHPESMLVKQLVSTP